MILGFAPSPSNALHPSRDYESHEMSPVLDERPGLTPVPADTSVIDASRVELESDEALIWRGIPLECFSRLPIFTY